MNSITQTSTYAFRHDTLFHSPQKRSTGVLTLLEELGADYELYVMNIKKRAARSRVFGH